MRGKNLNGAGRMTTPKVVVPSPEASKKEKEEKPNAEQAKGSYYRKSRYESYWGSNKVVPIVTLALLIDFVVLSISGDTVRSKIWENLWWAIGLHAVFAIAMTAMDPNPKTKSRLAMALAALCVLSFLKNVLDYDTKSVAQDTKNKVGEFVPSMPKLPKKTATLRPVSEEEKSKNHGIAYSFLSRKFGVDDTLLLMKIAELESGFVQTNTDGTVLRHHNSGDKGDDLGIMGINEKTWGDRAKQLNLDLADINDNLEMARVIFEERGCEAWVTCNKAKRLLANDDVEVIIAPIGSYSKRIQSSQKCYGVTDRRVHVKTDLGEFDMDPPPARLPNGGRNNWFAYTTTEGNTPARIEYHCQ